MLTGRWSIHPQKLQARPRGLVAQRWPPQGDASSISTLMRGDEGHLCFGEREVAFWWEGEQNQTGQVTLRPPLPLALSGALI